MKKKKGFQGSGSGGESSGGGWEVTFSGFVLILLCFFIMLCSFATTEEAKVMRFAKSFAEAVSILPGGLSFDSGKVILPPAPEMVDERSKLATLYHEVREYVHKLGLDREIHLSISEKGLVMKLADKVLFDLGQADLLQGALPLLNKVGGIILKTDYPIRIAGHTDNLPIHTELYPSNWELSTSRAVSVLRYFIEELKVPPKRLSAVGFGEFQPLYPNDTLAHRARNRRVEIVFVQPRREVTARMDGQ